VLKVNRNRFAAKVPATFPVRPSAQVTVPVMLLPLCVNTTSEVPKSFPVVSHLPSMRSRDVDWRVRLFGAFGEAESVAAVGGLGFGVVADGNRPPDAPPCANTNTDAVDREKVTVMKSCNSSRGFILTSFEREY
jgi:hypothetical protein